MIRLYFLPDDRIKLPDSVEYLNDLQDCSKGYWLICLYSTWSPQCQKVAPVFSELSRQYSCEGFKFGKSIFLYLILGHMKNLKSILGDMTILQRNSK